MGLAALAAHPFVSSDEAAFNAFLILRRQKMIW